MKKPFFLVLLLSSLVITACNNAGAQSNEEQSKPIDASVSTSSSEEDLEADVEDLGVKDFHTDLMNQYLADDWDSILTYVPQVSADKGTATGTNMGDVSQPNPIRLHYDELSAADNYYVEVAKDVKFTDSKIYETTDRFYDLYNTELGQKYYFRAADSEEDLEEADIKKFTVSDVAPRNIHVDGVINFRDVGGWESSLVEGAKIKQGLYYRCAQFNNGRTTTITDEGKAMIKELGIKVDIDMRDSYNVPSASPASSDDWEVEIFKGSVASSTENWRWEGKNGTDDTIAKTYKSIFEKIAEADENPIALHCTHGADRTGIVSYFLLGLLGASKEDCSRDYVMTRFAGERSVLPYDCDKGESEVAKWNTKTEALEGDSFAEKMYNHLHNDFGIEEETLETIRELFIPGYQA